MIKISVVMLALFLAGCGDVATQQRVILEDCLHMCKDGNVECIKACGNLLKGDCAK